MGCALTDAVEREAYAGPVPEKLESCSDQQLSSRLATRWIQNESRYVRDREIKEDSPLCSAMGPSVLQHRCFKSLLGSLGHLNCPIMGKKKMD